MSFVLSKDSEGKVHLDDAFLVEESMDASCPYCGGKHPPTMYDYESDHSIIGRRYYYCCPKYMKHYTDWGQHADRHGKTRILIRCRSKGNHNEEKERFKQIVRDSWKETNAS